jgi:hypothetical protein
LKETGRLVLESRSRRKVNQEGREINVKLFDHKLTAYGDMPEDEDKFYEVHEKEFGAIEVFIEQTMEELAELISE